MNRRDLKECQGLIWRAETEHNKISRSSQGSGPDSLRISTILVFTLPKSIEQLFKVSKRIVWVGCTTYHVSISLKIPFQANASNQRGKTWIQGHHLGGPIKRKCNLQLGMAKERSGQIQRQETKSIGVLDMKCFRGFWFV